MILISNIKLTTTLAVISFLSLFWCHSVESAKLPTMADVDEQSRSETRGIDDDVQTLQPGIIDGIEREISTGSMRMESDRSNGKGSHLVLAAELRGVGNTDLPGTPGIHGPNAYSNFGEQYSSTERREQGENSYESFTKGTHSTTIHALGGILEAIQFPTPDYFLSNQMFNANFQNLYSYLPPLKTVNSSNLNADSASSGRLPSDIGQLPLHNAVIPTAFVNPPPRCSGHCEVEDTLGDCRQDINCILMGGRL